MEQNRLEPFHWAARTFPLNRNRRLGEAYAHILLVEQTTVARTAQVIREVLPTDRNTADLWYHLARMDLKLGNKEAYTTDMVQLQKLTPHAVYQVVHNPTIEGRP